MTTEWLKIMLEEIARKKAEAEEAEREALRRREEAVREPPRGEQRN